jgi:hypothetical protein
VTRSSPGKFRKTFARRFRKSSGSARHLQVAALLCGPLVLFAVSNYSAKVNREKLLGAIRQGNEWQVSTADGDMRLVPFRSIEDEEYSTYFQLTSLSDFDKVHSGFCSQRAGHGLAFASESKASSLLEAGEDAGAPGSQTSKSFRPSHHKML